MGSLSVRLEELRRMLVCPVCLEVPGRAATSASASLPTSQPTNTTTRQRKTGQVPDLNLSRSSVHSGPDSNHSLREQQQVKLQARGGRSSPISESSDSDSSSDSSDDPDSGRVVLSSCGHRFCYSCVDRLMDAHRNRVSAERRKRTGTMTLGDARCPLCQKVFCKVL